MFGVTIHRKGVLQVLLSLKLFSGGQKCPHKNGKKTDLMSFLPWKYIMLFASHDGSVMRKTLRLVLSIALCLWTRADHGWQITRFEDFSLQYCFES